MQEIKIFISSPGDVGPERGLAQAVIERLQGDYWNFVRLEAVLWETEATRAVAHFNEEIIAPADCNIVLAFLWTRLGSRMPPQFTRNDGTRFESGTEWEIVTALEGFERNGRPDLMVYRRFEQPTLPDEKEDPKRHAEAVAQRAKLDAFWREHFQHPDGTIRRAFVAYADRDELVPRLTEQLRKLIHRRLPASVPAYDVFRPEPLPPGSPFRGLHAFGFADAPLFFGRSRAVAGIARQFETQAAREDGPGPFVLILGGSGSGKSSLARAGVAARLTHPNTVSGVDAWRRADCHPSAGAGLPPLDALAGALLAALPELAAQTVGDNHALDTAAGLAAMLADPEWLPLLEAPLRAALDAAAQSSKGRTARAFLVVDQLEELFTDKATSDTQRESFVHALAFLAGTRAVWIAATMRSEFFARAIELPALRLLMRGEGSFTLLPPDAGEISQIVRYPAAAANLAFERHPQTGESLADDIHAEATRDARALPLLEFLLQDLYEHRDENNVLLWNRYEEVGKLAGALVSHADAALGQLREGKEREALDLIFLALVTMDDQEQAVPTRNRAPRAALEPIKDGAGARVLEVFIAARLFVTDSEAAVPVVSLAHEALLAHWPYLQEFVQKHGTLLRSRRRLADLCNRWREKADYDEKGAGSLLLDEGSLAEAQEVVRFNPPDLTESEREFVHRSTLKSQGRVRRLRVAVGVFAVLAVAASLAGVVAWRQKQNAVVQEKEANTQRASAQAREAEAVEANRKYKAQLHEASMSDLATAQEHFAKKSWRLGMTFLGRALKYEPENRLASGWLWQEIVYGWGDVIDRPNDRDRLPLCLLAHSGAVNSAIFGRDGKYVLTASEDGTARLWDAATGRLLGLPMHHKDAVTSAVFSPDGARVLTASKDATAQMWDAVTGEPLGEPLRHDDDVASATFSPDGTRVLTFIKGNRDRLGEARLWDAGTGKTLGGALRHGDEANRRSVAKAGSKSKSEEVAQLFASLGDHLPPDHIVSGAFFSPDGARVLTVSAGKEARLWDAVNGNPVGKLLRHAGAITHATFTPDGASLLMASEGDAQWWDAGTGAPLDRPARQDIYSREIIFNPDTDRAITAGRDLAIIVMDGHAKWLDLKSGELYSDTIISELGTAVKSVSFSPDKTRLLSVGAGATGDEVRMLGAREPDNATTGEALRHDGVINSVVFSPDGARVLTAGSDGTARLWEVAVGKPPAQLLPHHNAVTNASFTPDGANLLTATLDHCFGGGEVQVWDVATGQPSGETFGYRSTLEDPVFSPDGSRVLFISSESEGPQEAYLFDLKTRKLIGKPLYHKDQIQSATFSRDSTRIVTACADTTARQWDATSGEPLGAPFRHETGVTYAAYSPDGKRIATSSGSTIRQWGTADGEPMDTPLTREGFGIEFVTYSPDGTRLLATGSQLRDDGKDKVGEAWQWEMVTGKLIGQPLHFPNVKGFTRAAYSPDMRLVVTSGEDSYARLWDANTSQLVGEPLFHYDGKRVIFSPAGKHFFTVGRRPKTLRGGAAQIWECPPPLPSPPFWFNDLVESLSGYRFDENSKILALSGQERVSRREAVRSALGTSGSTESSAAPWEQLAQWAFAPVTERRVTPGNPLSISELNVWNEAIRQRANVALKSDASLPLVHADAVRLTRLAIRDHRSFATALKWSEEAIAADPEYAEAQRQRAGCLKDLKRFPEASAAYETLLALPGTIGEDYLNAGLVAAELKQADRALELAQQALTIDSAPATAAQRLKASCLQQLERPTEALIAYQTLLDLSGATANDFVKAGYLAATMGEAEQTRDIFSRAGERFPESTEVSRMQGWAMLNLDMPVEALAAFRKSEGFVAKAAKQPAADLLAGLVIAQWLTGAKDGAVRDYQRLTATDAKYADADKVKALGWTEAETVPLLAALDETSRRRQKIAPKPANGR